MQFNKFLENSSFRVLPVTLMISVLIGVQTTFAGAPTGTMTSSPTSATMSVSAVVDTITITSGGTEITAANDIRIKIPSTINAEWVTAATALTIVNPATGVVSATASYPDSRTLLLDVTNNFDSGESFQITTGNLSLTPIYGASTAAALQWSIDGGVTYGNGASNTEVTVSAAVTSGFTSIAFTSSVVGATNTTTISGVSVQYPSLDTGSTYQITMPANYNVSGVSYNSDTFGGNPNFSTCTASGQVITCTTSQSMAGAGNASIVLDGITAAYVGSSTTTSANTSYNVPSAIQTIDNDIVVAATTVGALSATNVEPASLQASTSTSTTVSFTTASIIPNLGKIIVTFPAGYDVSAANGVVATSLSGLDGTWTASVSGQVVTLTQTGGGASAAGVKSLILSNITTPVALGSTGTYTITTAIAAGSLIQTDASVSADIIVAAGGGKSNVPTPPKNASVTIEGSPKVTTKDVMLTLSASGASQMRISNNSQFTGNFWETYSTSKKWTLLSGNGTKTVYVQFRDSRKNEGAILKASVLLEYSGLNPSEEKGLNQPELPLTPALPIILQNPLLNVNKPINMHFTDSRTHWLAYFIKQLFDMGVISGKTTAIFEPDQALTRAEAVKIALLTFHVDLDEKVKSSFADVTETDWFSPYVSTAEAKGLINGYKDGTFKPNAFINRAEALKILLTISGLDIVANQNTPFKDVQTTDWFAPYVNFAYSKALVSGKSDSNFNPGGTLTRAEMAKIAVLTSKL